MTFGNAVERILEVLLVTLVGIAVGTYWDWRALPVAAFLFLILRPAGSFLYLLGTHTSRLQRGLIGWFGIRGIGSLYYLAYAQSHGTHRAQLAEIASITVSVISLSVLVHGSSATPLLSFYARHRASWRRAPKRLG